MFTWNCVIWYIYNDQRRFQLSTFHFDMVINSKLLCIFLYLNIGLKFTLFG
jgi:hypothetical protein